MEGTRHEKTALILVSYVIGFTTAFIAFGVNRMSDSEIMYSTDVEPLSVNYEFESSEEIDDGISGVGFGKDGLFAITAGSERLLSADKNAFSASVASSVDGKPGFYYNIVDAEVSRNGLFVYFCEQLDASVEFCNPYVYSLVDDSVHVVKLDGDAYKASIVDHESSWSDESLLILNGMVSLNNQTPWIFVSDNEEVAEVENNESTTDLPELQ